MTAAELIDALRHADPDAPVVLQAGDEAFPLDYVTDAPGLAVLVAAPVAL